MRSPDVQQLGMFSYVSVEERVPADHPVRKLRVLVDGILAEMDELFASRFALRAGRPAFDSTLAPAARLAAAGRLQRAQ